MIPAFANTQPLPATFQGSTTDYIVFGEGNSFPSQNLICFSAGCGGAFQGTVYGPGVNSVAGPSILTTVWCVDYQLDVTYDAAYAANITTLGDVVNAPGNVRYGTLDGTGTPGWANSVTASAGVDPNSATYRYTLAAALISQYEDTSTAVDPTNPDGSSAVNKAIQEATWYVTYNNEYPDDGTTWPPAGDITAPDSCTSAGESNINNPNNYMCWVKYAEANAANVNTSQWGVLSGPVLDGVLQNPQVVGGYASYQTFLVQMDSFGQNNNQGVTPEPAYFVLTFALGGFILFVRRRRAAKQS
ncbi:MAG TPA: hypothetical protein VGL82_16090 [Bryobacteraceae bacterium]